LTEIELHKTVELNRTYYMTLEWTPIVWTIYKNYYLNWTDYTSLNEYEIWMNCFFKIRTCWYWTGCIALGLGWIYWTGCIALGLGWIYNCWCPMKCYMAKWLVQINRYIALGHTFVIFSSAYLLGWFINKCSYLGQINNEY